MLEKKENLLQKKASAEVEKAKRYTKAKNKRGMVIVVFTGFFFSLENWSFRYLSSFLLEKRL